MLIAKFIKLQRKAELRGYLDGRDGAVDSLYSSDTFAVNPWSQNDTTGQGWPFNYVDYPKPDFYLQTDPCSHTKTFVYSDKSPA